MMRALIRSLAGLDRAQAIRASRSVAASTGSTAPHGVGCRASPLYLHAASSSTCPRAGATLQQHARAFHASYPAEFAEKPKRDFYEVLGVDKNADKKDIKKAYYKAAKGCHPDTNTDNPAAAEQFAELTGAYEVLSDKEQRQRYDQYGHAGVDPNAQGNYDPFGQGGPFSGMNVEDLFGGGFANMFNQRGARRGPKRGGDVQVRLTLPFMEAVNGTKAEIDIATQVRCDTCDATGCKPGTSPSTCPQCQGTGQVIMSQGFFQMQATCDRCGGTGQVIADPCGTCGGRKFVTKQRTVQVDVPAGVDTGVSLRLVGEGHQGEKNAPAGNLYVELRVAADPFFQRDGSHVHTQIPISLAQAALGDTLTIPSLTGEVELQVPAGTQPDTQLVMRNRGIRKINSAGRGHQYIHLKVVVPRDLTPETRALIEKLAEIEEVERAQGKNSESAGAQFERNATNAAQRVAAALEAAKKTA